MENPDPSSNEFIINIVIDLNNVMDGMHKKT